MPKIKVNGELRDIVVDSDVTTQLSPLNDLSWAYGFMDENRVMNPLLDPFSKTGAYRYTPNKEFLAEAEGNAEVKGRIAEHVQKEMTDYELSQLDIATKKRNKSKQIEEFQSESHFGLGMLD
jgi:hypothetical protein